MKVVVEPTKKIDSLFVDSIGYNIFRNELYVKLTSGDIEHVKVPIDTYKKCLKSKDPDDFIIGLLMEIKKKTPKFKSRVISV